MNGNIKSLLRDAYTKKIKDLALKRLKEEDPTIRRITPAQKARLEE